MLTAHDIDSILDRMCRREIRLFICLWKPLSIMEILLNATSTIIVGWFVVGIVLGIGPLSQRIIELSRFTPPINFTWSGPTINMLVVIYVYKQIGRLIRPQTKPVLFVFKRITFYSFIKYHSYNLIRGEGVKSIFHGIKKHYGINFNTVNKSDVRSQQI